ncbi:MAG: fibronectin-binding autotransporter adhesin, partial [Humisphaera sp.]|nr:fibronectin-binding autotransporter adhesin [Humisphaera sp.]
IDTPINLASSTTMGVGDGLALTVTKPISGSAALLKTGPGTLRLTAANTYTGLTQAVDGTLLLDASLTTSSSFTATGDAKVELAAGGSRIIKTGALSITGIAQVDLHDNRLVTTTAVGVASGGVYTGVAGMIQRGQNEGTWTGPGLTSSAAAAAGGLTTLAVADASDVLDIGESETAAWSGQTVTGASTLVMYTYGGDANLDGFISGDDYSSIDFYVGTAASGYYFGDFNYDGIISGDDYSTIDFNFAAQGAPFPTSASASSIVAVPEPSTCCFALLAAATLVRRRQRRSRR